MDTYATLEPWQREMVMDGSSAIVETSTGDYMALQVYCSCEIQWSCSNTEPLGFITVTHGEFQVVRAILTKMSSKVHYVKQLKRLV